jgi:hypothetical protein
MDPWDMPSPLCPDQEPLYVATKLYLRFLQGLFGSLPEGTYRYDSVVEQSEINITDQAPVHMESLGRVPAIVTLRSPAQSADLGADHMQEQFMDGSRKHADLIRCTMTMNCIARNGVEAQRIAYLCFWGIKRFRRELMRNTIIHNAGLGLSISAETSPGALVAGDTEPGPVMVTVQSPFFIQERWNIIPELSDGDILRSIRGMLGVVRPGTEAEVRPPSQSPRFRVRPPSVKGRVLLQQTVVAGEDC